MMLELGRISLGLALVSSIVTVYCITGIMSYLSSKGVKVNWLLIRLKWFSYMARYRELTVEETGEAGPFYRGYIVSSLIALVLVIAGALMLNQS